MRLRAAALGALLLAGAGTAGAANDPPGAQAVLEVLEPARPGFVPEAAPPRFVLLDEGRVLVGGTSAVFSGTLARSEASQLEARLSALRRSAPAGPVRLGPGSRRFVLRLLKGKPLELEAQGDPETAAPDQQPLARLLADLAAFDHASLRPLAPSAYLARAVEQALPGGCREWTLAVPLAELLTGPREVAATQLQGWPSGAVAASVCERGRRYAVTFSPVLSGAAAARRD